jgi:DNA-directed RNA polymerase specialized sigma24 family protein
LVVSDRSRGVLGSASRGLVADIDKQLAKLNGKLAPHERRIAERQRLQAARDALTAEGRPQITRDDVAAYLDEHGETRPGVIAKALGVPVATISTHLYRGKRTLFVSGEKGWDLRERPATSQAGETGK